MQIEIREMPILESSVRETPHLVEGENSLIQKKDLKKNLDNIIKKNSV
jgi:hypothetical protein